MKMQKTDYICGFCQGPLSMIGTTGLSTKTNARYVDYVCDAHKGVPVYYFCWIDNNLEYLMLEGLGLEPDEEEFIIHASVNAHDMTIYFDTTAKIVTLDCKLLDMTPEQLIAKIKSLLVFL